MRVACKKYRNKFGSWSTDRPKSIEASFIAHKIPIGCKIRPFLFIAFSIATIYVHFENWSWFNYIFACGPEKPFFKYLWGRTWPTWNTSMPWREVWPIYFSRFMIWPRIYSITRLENMLWTCYHSVRWSFLMKL